WLPCFLAVCLTWPGWPLGIVVSPLLLGRLSGPQLVNDDGVSDLPVGLLADDDGRIAVEARQKAALLNVERVLHRGTVGGDAHRPFQHVHLIDDDQGEWPLAPQGVEARE